MIRMQQFLQSSQQSLNVLVVMIRNDDQLKVWLRHGRGSSKFGDVMAVPAQSLATIYLVGDCFEAADVCQILKMLNLAPISCWMA